MPAIRNTQSFVDFSGGWAPARHASRMHPTQLRDMRNFVVGPNGQLITRPPFRRSGSKANAPEIMAIGINQGEQNAVPWGAMIADGGTGFTYYGFNNTNTLIPLTNRDSNVDQVPKAPAKLIRYRGIWYATWWDTSYVPERIDPVSDVDFQVSGIAAPATGPTVVAAAGGSLADAIYQCCVTYYNPRTGTESPISVRASVTTAAPNSTINWSNIPVAVSAANTGYAQVQWRKLYRTLPNQTNEYYLVTTLTNNTATTFSDSVTPANLGARVSTDTSGPYSPNIGGFAIWRERMWIPGIIPTGPSFTTNLEALAYSKPGLVEVFTADGFLPVGQNESSVLVACEAFDERLIVWKTGSVWKVTGTGPSNFSVSRIPSPTGTPMPFCNAVGPDRIFFYGSDGYFYFTDGVQVRNISERLGRLDLCSDLKTPGGGQVSGEVNSIVWASRNLFLTVHYLPASKTSTVYAYDYVKDAWCYWDVSNGGTGFEVPRPRSWAMGFDSSNFGNRLYVVGQQDAAAWVMTFEDDLYEDASTVGNLTDEAIVTENQNNDYSPVRSIRTKDFDAGDLGVGAPGDAFIINQVWLRVAWDATITNATNPDANFPLTIQVSIMSDTNTGAAVSQVFAGPSSINWSTTDGTNNQWFPVGLSSQQQGVASAGLLIEEAAGAAPRRHAITGIRIDATGLGRMYAQPGVTFRSNVTGP